MNLNQRLHKLKTAFQALEHTTPKPHPQRQPERHQTRLENSCVACERSTHTGPPPIRPRFQEPLLYPLSYGGSRASVGRRDLAQASCPNSRPASAAREVLAVSRSRQRVIHVRSTTHTFQ